MSRLRAKHSKQKEMGKNMDPGRAQLGKKMDQLEEYTSLVGMSNIPRLGTQIRLEIYQKHEILQNVTE